MRISGKNAVPPETKFRIGSVSKQFTAVAFTVAEEKKLVLSDSLAKYYPDFAQGKESRCIICSRTLPGCTVTPPSRNFGP